MKSKFFTLFIIVAISLGFNGILLAGSTITQVTSNSYEDSFARMEGDYLVWQAHINGDWEVFLYNTATKETTQITDNTYDDLSPQTDGYYVVWQGFSDGEWDIFLWDGIQVDVISDRSVDDTAPQIADGFIVWSSEPLGDASVGHGEIVLYDVGTGTDTTLSEEVGPGNTKDASAPRINGEMVMWFQTDDLGDSTLYMYDIRTGAFTENPDNVKMDSPYNDGKLRVLTRHDGHDMEIYLYHIESKKYHRITNNGLQDRYPTISGNYVAWMASGDIFLAECKYLGLIRPGDNAVPPGSPAPTFTWEGIGYTGFQLAFSEESNFPAGKTLTLPLGASDLLSETSYTPTQETWGLIRTMAGGNGSVYWKIQGQDTHGNLAVSATRSFTVENDGGGGGGGSGQCFIDTTANSFGWWRTAF